jgi:ubiquitin-like modifier-activating enzyme 5
MTLKPNKNCDDNKCVKKQEEYALYLQQNPEALKVEEVVVEEVVHEDNEWGISLVDSESNEGAELPGRDLNLVAGLKVAYTIPEQPMKSTQDDSTIDDTAESLDELMSRMKNI